MPKYLLLSSNVQRQECWMRVHREKREIETCGANGRYHTAVAVVTRSVKYSVKY